jgi:hypothetical protein
MLFQVKTMSSHHLAREQGNEKASCRVADLPSQFPVERFTGLLAARMNLPGAMQRRRYAE